MSSVAFYAAGENAVYGLRRRLSVRLAGYRIFRQTLAELRALSDRDLADLGLARYELTMVARRAALDKEAALLAA